MTPTAPIRVLVVDDSPTIRTLLRAMLEEDSGIKVVGEAADGADAVRQAVKLMPDLITMDVVMPLMDGLEATKEIMISAPTPILIVAAVENRSAMDLSFDATQAGALGVVAKPENPLAAGFAEKREELLSMVKAMAQVKVVRRWGSRPGRLTSRTDGAALPSVSAEDRQVVLIGTSTGGPAALRRIFMDLPRDFAAPVLVVQHIARGFVAGLASWLNAGCSLHVKVAEEGEDLLPRTVYLAPDDRHLGLRSDGRALISDRPPIGGFRPSATFLFETAAEACGSKAVGVILTGMGNDGVAGLKALHGAGATVLAQDERSSIVYGMAQEAVKEGVVDSVLPLESIASKLTELVSGVRA
ncbi:MAG TPA: chemotaxis-specific protein-glutamate methyltransferase CheB [Gemmatimonadaceae bacterium]|nr:chemotaxis-specific protein-glutamate methyltransferase CheB [Gemmatimonadaceae bacterium]